jgi:hypothetical protein
VDLSEEDDPTLPAASFEESGRRAVTDSTIRAAKVSLKTYRGVSGKLRKSSPSDGRFRTFMTSHAPQR